MFPERYLWIRPVLRGTVQLTAMHPVVQLVNIRHTRNSPEVEVGVSVLATGGRRGLEMVLCHVEKLRCCQIGERCRERGRWRRKRRLHS